MSLSSAEFIADIKRTFNDDLSELQDMGVVKRRVSKDDKRRILQYLDQNANSFSEEDGFDLESLIDEKFPHLITQSYRRDMAELVRGEQKRSLTGPYAPDLSHKLDIPEREPNERPATEKQKDYLLALGVKDQRVREPLGIKQASSLINQAIEYRERFTSKIEKTAERESRVRIEVSWEFFVWLMIFAVIGALLWVILK